MATIARVIGEAAVRLRADGKNLAGEMRAVLSKALKEASDGLVADGATDSIAKDAERTAGRVKGVFAGVLAGGKSMASGLATAVTSGARLALIGAKAGVALAGVASLTTGVLGLGAALAQAAGAAGLLPAILAAVQAGAATLKLGLTGVSDAFAAIASGDVAAIQEALKNLSPAARTFVTEVAKVKPAFDAMRLDVQEKLFRGLGASVQSLAARYMPILRDGFTGIAEAMNRAGKEAINFANNGETAGQVSLLVDNIKGSFQELVPAIAPALSALLDITQVGSDFLPGMADSIGSLSIRFAEFIRNAAGSGQLKAFFQNAIDTIKQLATVAGNIGKIFGDVFSAANQAGGGLLSSLVRITEQVEAFTNSAQGNAALVQFFSSMGKIIDSILPIVLELAKVVGTNLVPILADLATTIGPAFAPLVTALGPALEAARPGIQALATGLASLISAAAPLIGIVGQLAAVFGRVLGKVFESLAPVLEQVATVLGDTLTAILPQLEPVLVQVATAIGQVLAALVPLIPVFFQLLQAVLPILPPLLQLIQAVIPPLISLVQAVVPIIVSLAQVLAALIPPITAVVTTILNILIPPLNLIADVIAFVAGMVADRVRDISTIFTTVFTAISTFVTGIWGAIVNVFRGAVQTIGGFVRGGFNAIRDAIAGVISGISNTVGGGINTVIGFFRDLPGKALSALSGLISGAAEAGRNIVEGLISGIGRMAGAIKDKLLGIVQGAWDSVLGFLGIASPSKLADETFQQVGRGAIRGLDKIGPAVADAARAMAVEAMASLQTPLNQGVSLGALSGANTVGAGAGGAGSVVLHQTNVMQPGADILTFSSEVSRNMSHRLASGASALPVAQGGIQSGMAAPGGVYGVRV